LAQSSAETTDRTQWFVLALVVVAQFMVVLDVAIVNVALMSIRTDLHFSQENLQWVITAYSMVFGGFRLLGAIGVAIATTIATSVTSRYVANHAGLNAFSGSALTHGFQIAFYVFAGLGAAGALISALMLESRPAQPDLQLSSDPPA
jgi:MFS family permease